MAKLSGDYIFGEILELREGSFSNDKGQTVHFRTLHMLVTNEDRTVDRVKIGIPLTFNASVFQVGAHLGVPVKNTNQGERDIKRKLRENTPTLPGEIPDRA